MQKEALGEVDCATQNSCAADEDCRCQCAVDLDALDDTAFYQVGGRTHARTHARTRRRHNERTTGEYDVEARTHARLLLRRWDRWRRLTPPFPTTNSEVVAVHCRAASAATTLSTRTRRSTRSSAGSTTRTSMRSSSARQGAIASASANARQTMEHARACRHAVSRECHDEFLRKAQSRARTRDRPWNTRERVVMPCHCARRTSHHARTGSSAARCDGQARRMTMTRHDTP